MTIIKSLSLFGQGFSFHTYYPPEVYGEHPQNWVAEKDTNGFIYFGNGDGFLSFNGVDWELRHIGETGRAQSLFKTKNGQMFVNGHSDFGVIAPDSMRRINYQSLSEQFYSPNEPQPYIWEVYEVEGRLYNRHSRGIAIYDPVQHTLKDYPPPVDIDYLSNSLQIGDTIIVDSNLGLFAFHDSSYSKIEGSDFFATQRLQFATQLDEKKYLLGSTNDERPYIFRESFLHIFDGENIKPFVSEADEYLDQHSLFRGIRINEEQIAIATLTGGVVFINTEGKLLKIFTERTGLHANEVYNLYVDQENILWLMLSEGIQKLDLNESVMNYPESSGIEDVVWDITVNEKDVYVQTLDGLYMNIPLRPENIDHFEKVDFKKNIQGSVTWNGMMYVYGYDGIFTLQKNGHVTQIYNAPISTVAETNSGERNLTFLAPGKKITLDGKNISVETLGTDDRPGNSVWFQDKLFFVTGSSRIYKTGELEVEPVPIRYDTTQHFRINRIGVINNGLFIGVEGSGENSGLYEYDISQAIFTKSDFLRNHPDFNDKQIFNFLQCSDSETWFIANMQLIKVIHESGEWIAQNSPYQLAGKKPIYSMACGMEGVWLGGTKTLTHISNSDWNYKTDFKTNITGIFARNDSLIYGGFGEPLKHIVLPYTDNELRFTYAAASFIDPERNNYQVKLEGFDNNWSEWNAETQKDYTNIPEGSYTFKVRSKNVYEVAGITDSISFTILPPWYRTWWAYLLYTITIAGIFYVAYIIRVNQILKVYRIRNSIASDLHDEVSATLSSISYFAQAIKSDSIKGDKNRFVTLISDSAGDAKEKISDIVWAINPEHDDWPSFLSKCRRFASDLLESKDMKYSLKIVENVPGTLDMRLRQHLWLIYKEMVTNAVRHSQAKQLDVIMSYKHGTLKLVVQDDGKGMDIDKVKKGNGLVNIHQRADQVNGNISLTSDIGFGTRWVLKISL
ncbi:MAG: triple tyrosine motif-containing protein [Balneolaceae bacterium]